LLTEQVSVTYGAVGEQRQAGSEEKQRGRKASLRRSTRRQHLLFLQRTYADKSRPFTTYPTPADFDEEKSKREFAFAYRTYAGRREVRANGWEPDA
jgi:hypothetical protein